MHRDICALREIRDGGKKRINVGGVKLMLCRRGNQVLASENRCPHQNLPLRFARFDGHKLTCRFHNARYDLESGELEKKPWLLPNSGRDCLVTYDAKVKDGRVLVDLDPDVVG